MERLIFREEQAIRQSFIPWLLVPGWLLMIVFIGIGFYQQLYLGQQYGDQPMSDSALLWTGILTIFVLSGLFIVILSGCLYTEIWTDGIRYRFPPFIRRVKFIPLTEIVSAEVTKYRPVAEFGGWGWRKSMFKRKTAYNISGNTGLRIIFKSGRQIMFGTLVKDELQRAVSKMMLQEKDKYSK